MSLSHKVMNLLHKPKKGREDMWILFKAFRKHFPSSNESSWQLQAVPQFHSYSNGGTKKVTYLTSSRLQTAELDSSPGSLTQLACCSPPAPRPGSPLPPLHFSHTSLPNAQTRSLLHRSTCHDPDYFSSAVTRSSRTSLEKS